MAVADENCSFTIYIDHCDEESVGDLDEDDALSPSIRYDIDNQSSDMGAAIATSEQHSKTSAHEACRDILSSSYEVASASTSFSDPSGYFDLELNHSDQSVISALSQSMRQTLQPIAKRQSKKRTMKKKMNKKGGQTVASNDSKARTALSKNPSNNTARTAESSNSGTLVPRYSLGSAARDGVHGLWVWRHGHHDIKAHQLLDQSCGETRRKRGDSISRKSRKSSQSKRRSKQKKETKEPSNLQNGRLCKIDDTALNNMKSSSKLSKTEPLDAGKKLRKKPKDKSKNRDPPGKKRVLRQQPVKKGVDKKASLPSRKTIAFQPQHSLSKTSDKSPLPQRKSIGAVAA